MMKRLAEMTESDVRTALWQLERMDWIDGREPTLGEAVAVLSEVEGQRSELKAIPKEYMPAHLMPLGVWLYMHDASALRVDSILQNEHKVTLRGVNENTGHAWKNAIPLMRLLRSSEPVRSCNLYEWALA